MSKRTSVEQPSCSRKMVRRLVEVPLRSKEPMPQNSGKMGHFKLTRSPKRKLYKPSRMVENEAILNPDSTQYFDKFVTELGSTYSSLTILISFLSGKKWGIIHNKVEIEPSLQTPICNPRMVITSENEALISFRFEALYTTLAAGFLPANLDRFHILVKSLLHDSGYFMCQGIPPDVSFMMSFTTKNARIWGLPFGRVDHKDCPMWLMAIPTGTSTSTGVQRCDKCTNLMYYIAREAKKQQKVTPEQQAARVQPSSHYPIKFLSPVSLQLRRENIAKDRKILKWSVNPSY